jgi:hypothetical protein
MKRTEGNAQLVTAGTATLPHHTHITSSSGKFEVESTTEPTLDAVSPPPILITEQEILFSTAAAVPVRPTRMRPWRQTIHDVRAAMQRLFLTSTADSSEPHPHYPKHYEFLDKALMAREMDRL